MADCPTKINTSKSWRLPPKSSPTHSGVGVNSCPSLGTCSARMDHFALDGLPPTSAVETIPCAVTFVSTAVANHEAALVLRIKPGGELLGARLNFILWRMDQGELVLASA